MVRQKQCCERFVGQACTVPANDFRFENIEFEFEEKDSVVVSSVRELQSQCQVLKDDCESLKVELKALRHFLGRMELVEHELTSQKDTVAQSVCILEHLKSAFYQLKHEFERLVPNFPRNGPKSLDGIIAHLTRKYSDKVRTNEILAITSKSTWKPGCEPEQVAHLNTNSRFVSENGTGEWICWDFRERRIRPTHYTIACPYLKSWVIEGSLDGLRDNWTEIDRQTNNQDFTNVKDHSRMASFACSNHQEFRFIRLTQTDHNHTGDDYLSIYTVEFFGALSE
jgi:hypothetical protein